MSKNNLKKLAEEYKAPEALKRRVYKKVNSNLGMLKFIGDIFDLYIGKAGRVMTSMLDSFDEKEPIQYAASDDKELPPSASNQEENDSE